jgi:hypothetical protein
LSNLSKDKFETINILSDYKLFIFLFLLQKDPNDETMTAIFSVVKNKIHLVLVYYFQTLQKVFQSKILKQANNDLIMFESFPKIPNRNFSDILLCCWRNWNSNVLRFLSDETIGYRPHLDSQYFDSIFNIYRFERNTSNLSKCLTIKVIDVRKKIHWKSYATRLHGDYTSDIQKILF